MESRPGPWISALRHSHDRLRASVDRPGASVHPRDGWGGHAHALGRRRNTRTRPVRAAAARRGADPAGLRAAGRGAHPAGRDRRGRARRAAADLPRVL